MRTLYKNSLKLVSIPLACIALNACVTSTPGEYKQQINTAAAAKLNVRMGIDYLKRNNTIMAKKKFDTAVQLAPQDPSSWYGLGYFYEATDNLALADQFYQKAIKVSSKSGAAHNNYGTFLCRHGRYQEGIKQFIKAVKEPGYLQVPSAYENAGLCEMMAKNTKSAKTFFKLAVNNGPEQKTSLYELAKLDYQSGNIKAARSYYQALITVSKPSKDTKALAAVLYKGKRAPRDNFANKTKTTPVTMQFHQQRTLDTKGHKASGTNTARLKVSVSNGA